MAVFHSISPRLASPHYVFVVEGCRRPGKGVENSHSMARSKMEQENCHDSSLGGTMFPVCQHRHGWRPPGKGEAGCNSLA